MRAPVFIAAAALAMTAAPTASSSWETPGEVYRVWLDGRRINLSASPADDVAPAVSPDGRRVAFASDRGARCRERSCVNLYVVGSDGRGLRRVASSLPPPVPNEETITWSPDGERLIYEAVRGAVYVIRPDANPKLVGRGGGSAWSPDGRVIAFVTGDWRGHHVVVVRPDGRRVWRVRGINAGVDRRVEWSATGRLAVVFRGRSVRVYDSRGRFKMAFRGRVARWSRDGQRLASIAANQLEVRALSGSLLFRKTVPGLFRGRGLAWADDRRVVVVGETDVLPPRVVDVRSGRVSETHNGYFGPLSPDGQMSAGVVKTSRGFALVVSRVDDTGRRILVRRTPCYDLIDATIKWLPDSRSLVYDFKCQPDARP